MRARICVEVGYESDIVCGGRGSVVLTYISHDCGSVPVWSSSEYALAGSGSKVSRCGVLWWSRVPASRGGMLFAARQSWESQTVMT